jgi:hypothetical protein
MLGKGGRVDIGGLEGEPECTGDIRDEVVGVIGVQFVVTVGAAVGEEAITLIVPGRLPFCTE